MKEGIRKMEVVMKMDIGPSRRSIKDRNEHIYFHIHLSMRK
ncbi:hypothetical protein ACWE42_21855 [Sutcliffiella cohnii]|nr:MULTISPECIES: hypothetical protein [Sutcliffiella]MED4017538.1 hypothetical protein [Sutcliffiella cohnii]WBL16010.1 hypothetical protein O1A01_05080 [Sutcliffiella sp. NC1]